MLPTSESTAAIHLTQVKCFYYRTVQSFIKFSWLFQWPHSYKTVIFFNEIRILQNFDESPSRAWLSNLLYDGDATDDNKNDTERHQFVDSFRYFHPNREKAYTCWRTLTGARATNFGTRIDYIFGDVDLVKTHFLDCDIKPDVLGSDHCPVEATTNCSVSPAENCPQLCTKYFPEFAGKQQKLSAYFTKATLTGTSKLLPQLPADQASDVVLNGSQKRKTFPEERGNEEQPRKKLKTEKENKQQKLLSFFKTTPSMQSKEPLPQRAPSTATAVAAVIPKVSVATKSAPGSAASWKNIFKGPPTAPKCKGHNEPCLLRTVKKDSLNKGRQFWVCCRPDGEKGNPLARCDHFEWVKKKVKPKK